MTRLAPTQICLVLLSAGINVIASTTSSCIWLSMWFPILQNRCWLQIESEQILQN